MNYLQFFNITTYLPNLPFLFNNILFYNIISNTDGAGMLIDNINSNVNITQTTFLLCSALKSGGGFKINCNNFNQDKSCFIKCSARTYEGYKWGHAGIAIVKQKSFFTLSTIIYCSPSNDMLGHVAFALDQGEKNTSNINMTSCLSVYAHSSFFLFGGLYISGNFINFFNISTLEAIILNTCNNCILSNINFIQNFVSNGALTGHYATIFCFNCIFFENTNDLCNLAASTFSFFNCLTNKNNFIFGTISNCSFNILNPKFYSINIFPINECQYNIKNEISKKKKYNWNFINNNLLILLLNN